MCAEIKCITYTASIPPAWPPHAGLHAHVLSTHWGACTHHGTIIYPLQSSLVWTGERNHPSWAEFPACTGAESRFPSGIPVEESGGVLSKGTWRNEGEGESGLLLEGLLCQRVPSFSSSLPSSLSPLAMPGTAASHPSLLQLP